MPYILWTIAAIVFKFLQGTDLSMGQIVRMFIFGTGMVPYYFIIVILQFYILLPVLKRINLWIALSLNVLSLVALYVLNFAGYILPFPYYALPFTMWIGYFVIGIELRRKQYNFNIAYISIFLIVSLVLSIVESVMISNFAFSTVKISSFLYSMAVIIFFMNIKKHFIQSKLLVKLGSDAFGIFFTHMFFLIVFRKLLSEFQLATALVQIICYFLTISCSYIAISVSKKILPKQVNQSVGFNL